MVVPTDAQMRVCMQESRARLLCLGKRPVTCARSASLALVRLAGREPR